MRVPVSCAPLPAGGEDVRAAQLRQAQGDAAEERPGPRGGAARHHPPGTQGGWGLLCAPPVGWGDGPWRLGGGLGDVGVNLALLTVLMSNNSSKFMSRIIFLQ